MIFGIEDNKKVQQRLQISFKFLMELNTLKTKCKVKSWKELVLKIQDEVRYTDEFHL